MKNIFSIFILLILPNISLANERFIPIELWLGIKSTGTNDLKFYYCIVKFT